MTEIRMGRGPDGTPVIVTGAAGFIGMHVAERAHVTTLMPGN